jgi:hypothetical protein
MLVNPTDYVGETAITIVLSNIARRTTRTTLDSASDVGGASVGLAARSKTIDSPAYEIFQCLDCESIAWISRAHRNL